MCRLDLDSALQRLSLLLRSCNRLLAHNASTPMAFLIFVSVSIALFDGGEKFGEFRFVFRADFGKG